ncbi:MAG: LVIVD repeat-containing protein [Candidatus Hodarchaeota archaeon]
MKWRKMTVIVSFVLIIFLIVGFRKSIAHVNSHELIFQELGQFNDGGEVVALQIIEDIAYVADWDDGLEIVDITDPSNPIELGQYAVECARGIQVVNDVLYLAYNTNGLFILNISDPSNPTELGAYYASDAH